MSLRRSCRWACSLAFLLLLPAVILAGRAAADVTQGQALATVIASYAAGDPEEFFLEIYGPPSPLVAGSSVQELYNTEPVLAFIATDTWFFWIDYYPRAEFAHRTKFVGVRKDTGSIAFAIDSTWWPVVNGIERYRTYVDRFLSGELVYPLGPKPELGSPASPVLPSPSPLAAPQPPLAPPASGKVCAIVVSGEDTTGGANNNWWVKFKGIISALDSTNANGPRVHPDSIRTAVQPDSMGLCQLIESVPTGYDKVYFYYSGHGERNTGRLVLKDKRMTPMDLVCKIKALQAKNVCLMIDCCFSGNYVEAMCEKGLCGTILTATNSSESAWQFLQGVDGRAGSINNEALVWCLKQPHASASDLFACVRDSVMRWCASLPPADPKSRAGGQHPQFSAMYEFTKSGQALAFSDVPGCPTMCLKFYDVAGANPATCANSTLYCEQLDFSWGLGTAWECVRAWNWNVGETRYYNPDLLLATGRYELAVHSNYYPVRVGVTWPTAAVPDTPSNAAIFPAYSVGWNDGSGGEFNPVLGTGGGGVPANVVVSPSEWSLCSVPRFMGTFDSNPVNFHFPVVIDPIRPFLYVDNDPAQGFDGDLVITLGAANLPYGPAQIQMQLSQPGGNLQFRFGTILPSTNGSEVQFTLPAGSVAVEDMNVTFQVLASPSAGKDGAGAPPVGNSFPVDYVTVDFLLTDITGLPGPGGPPQKPVVLGSYPNPFSSSTSLRFELSGTQNVTLRVYDLQGRRVRDLLVDRPLSGKQEQSWDGLDDGGRRAAAGVYFFRLETPGFVDSRKIVLRR